MKKKGFLKRKGEKWTKNGQNGQKTMDFDFYIDEANKLTLSINSYKRIVNLRFQDEVLNEKLKSLITLMVDFQVGLRRKQEATEQ